MPDRCQSFGPRLSLALVLLLGACSCRGSQEVERPDAVPPPLRTVPVRTEAPTLPEPEPIAPPVTAVFFDLLANRPLAHVGVGAGLLIEAGSPGFARYAHGNRDRSWLLNLRHEGLAAAAPRDRTPTLHVPLTAAQAEAAGSIAVHVWRPRDGGVLGLDVNEQNVGQHELAGGWQSVSWPVPSDVLRAGENTLTLNFPANATASGSEPRAAVSHIAIGANGWSPDGTSLLASASEPSLSLLPERSLTYYVVLPTDSLLEAAIGGGREERPGSCRLRAAIETEGGASLLYEVGLDGREAGEPLWTRLTGAPVDEVVRLTLSIAAGCDEVTLSHLALSVVGEPPEVPAFEPPRNVVIWLIDTLRADRLRSINPETRVQSPALDEFAAEGVVFRRAYVQGNESFASHAAIFAGRYPISTGVLSSRDHVDDDEVLIAELIGRTGRLTGGYSSNGHINAGNGFLQGFDQFVNTLRENYRYRAPGMLSHSTRWVDEHGADPFFLYVGTVDCHVTYRAYEDILPLYDPDPYDGPFQRYVSGDELGLIKGGRMRITARDQVRIEAIYDNTVTFSDRHFGGFMDHLETTGHLDDTLVIVTSDHGDEFWEHGSVGHAHNVHDELVHVPLLMRYPDALPPGTVVERGVDTVDILPTVAHLLGEPVPDAAQGESLVPLVHGVGANYPRPAFAQQRGRTHAMSLFRYKTIWNRGGERRLYDLVDDPTEQRDISAQRPFAMRFTTDAMGLFMAYRQEWRKADWGVPSNLAPGFRARN